MPMPEPTPCAGCGTTEAVAYLETNAGDLGHAPHGLLCSTCWREWMRGRRWGKGRDRRTDDLEAAWEAAWEGADEGREVVDKQEPEPEQRGDVDLFGKSTKPKKRRRR